MDAQRCSVQLGHVGVERLENLHVLDWRCVADRVGNVDRRGACGKRRAHNFGHKLGTRTGRIFAREFDVGNLRTRIGNRVACLLEHLLGRHPQFVFHVQIAGGDKDVEAWRFGVFKCLPRGVDIGLLRAIERSDRAAAHMLGDEANALDLARGGDRKASLDDVHAEALKLARNLQLLLGVQADPRRLLTVTQGGIKNLDVVAAIRSAHRAPFRSVVRHRAPVLWSCRCLRRASSA